VNDPDTRSFRGGVAASLCRFSACASSRDSQPQGQLTIFAND
jgi:hypothetical protein